MFVLMLPMLIGAFGMGLDISRNVYIRTTLQNDLDLATVAGAAVTTINDESQVSILSEDALATVERVYALNRAQGPATECWGDRETIAGTTIARCWKVVGTPTVNRAYLYYSVRERTRNAFLPVVGVPTQTYTLESRARVKQQLE